MKSGLGQFHVVLIIVAILAVAFASGPGRASEERNNSSRDKEAILKVASDWDEAWNRHDVKALGDLLADDVDFVTARGVRVKGKAPWAQRLGRAFEGPYKSTKRSTTSADVRFLAPDVAVLRAQWTMSGIEIPVGTVRPPGHGIMLMVLTKTDGRWQVVAAQNTTIGARP